jgi:hypothetical protein
MPDCCDSNLHLLAILLQSKLALLKPFVFLQVSLLDKVAHVFLRIHFFLAVVYPNTPVFFDPFFLNLRPNPFALLLLVSFPLLRKGFSIKSCIFFDIGQLRF